MDDARVRLLRLDDDLTAALLGAAVADADPLEVMPPVDGPPGWTADRRAAFLAFHHEWAATPTTYAILVDGRVVGAARLQPAPAGGLETGLWIGRSHRAQGVGGAVVRLLVAEARARGADRINASTTRDNTAARRLLANAGANFAPGPPANEQTRHTPQDPIDATLPID